MMVSINALALLKKFAKGEKVKRPASEHIRELVTLRAIEWDAEKLDWTVTDAGEDLLQPKNRGRKVNPESAEIARQVMAFLGQLAENSSDSQKEACRKLAAKLPGKPAWHVNLGEDLRIKDDDDDEDA